MGENARDLRARNYSPRTEETPIAAVVHFARHFGTPPDQLGPEHVIAYQVWLRDQKRASHVLFNQTVCALRFFYGEVLDRRDVVDRICYARHERRLPVVLSIELLPVPYFHVVFTVPEVLNVFALHAPRVFYNLLFQAAGQTLIDVARSRRR